MNIDLALPDNTNNENHTEEFLKLVMANQHRIKAFIRIMMPNISDADDIMQETMLVMWRKFSDFQPETNFVSWAVKIAHLQILSFRKTNRNKRLLFNEELFEDFSSNAIEIIENADTRVEALRYCVKKLDKNDQKLIQMRYEADQTAKNMAEKTGINLKTLYRAITKIQYLLHSCIQRRLLAEDKE
ncbi:MAG: sigma-70 family RNA polymerase sigma factor [Phycisphaerae bacterium]|nr:sigma-70 family RNA polymerase sigma factor [Phycisphaerae bacterium]